MKLAGWRSWARILALLPWLVGATAQADESHTFWEVTGQHNKVWLLGSVHLLSDQDSTLPPVVNAAFADAETIVEEVDLFAAMTDMLGGGSARLENLPAGQTLSGVVGSELFARVQQEARGIGLDASFFSGMQPWYVALQIQQMRLLKQGLSPLNGVDYQIAERAMQAHKPLIGLETIDEQLSFFAKLSMAEQRDFLRATLDEKDTDAELRETVTAWRHGDLATLATQLRKGADESPALFKTLTTDRNLRWLPQIEKMLQDPSKDYLVVTGALHMVGDDGLVALLRKRGYRVEQK